MDDEQHPNRRAEEQKGPAMAPSRNLPRPSGAKRLAELQRLRDKLRGRKPIAVVCGAAVRVDAARYPHRRAEEHAGPAMAPSRKRRTANDFGSCLWRRRWMLQAMATGLVAAPYGAAAARMYAPFALMVCVCVHRVRVRARVRASSLAQDRGRASLVLVAWS